MGYLFLLTGFFGAGKTTLAEDACKKIDNLQYFTTVTTRPPRSYDSTFPNEYEFVNVETYNNLRTKSREWDHGEMKGHFYGQDIEAGHAILNAGKNLLRCVLSDVNVISRISNHFPDQVKLIWVDTPLEVANERLLKLNDVLRMERVEGQLQTEKNSRNIKTMADYVFQPIGKVDRDTKRFNEFLTDIIKMK